MQKAASSKVAETDWKLNPGLLLRVFNLLGFVPLDHFVQGGGRHE